MFTTMYPTVHYAFYEHNIHRVAIHTLHVNVYARYWLVVAAYIPVRNVDAVFYITEYIKHAKCTYWSTSNTV